jgi:hypothetical protein
MHSKIKEIEYQQVMRQSDGLVYEK